MNSPQKKEVDMSDELVDLKKEIDEGIISAIALDNSVFHRYQYNLQHGLLKRLNQFGSGRVKFVVPEIIEKELRRGMNTQAADKKDKLCAALEEASAIWKLDKNAALSSLFGECSAFELVEKNLEHFFKDTSAIVLTTDSFVRFEDLLNLYFNALPPFAVSGKKKNEFPDAIALLSLENWAAQENTKVLVVSNDGDWKGYCQNSSRLAIVGELSHALSLFQDEISRNYCEKFISSIQSGDRYGFGAAISKVFDEEGWRIEIIPEADAGYDYEPEVSSVDFYYVDVEDYEPVEFKDGVLTANLTLCTDVDIECCFNFGLWDAEDRRSVPFGSTIRSWSTTIDVEVVLSLRCEPDFEIEGIEITNTIKNISFGDIEPDWKKDFDPY